MKAYTLLVSTKSLSKFKIQEVIFQSTVNYFILVKHFVTLGFSIRYINKCNNYKIKHYGNGSMNNIDEAA